MRAFSIILPVRNGGSHVKACVRSLLDQDYPHFNIIVLDNNSSDGTREWIESLAEPRITVVFSEDTLGITENWARIKTVAKNEFMTMIGHDDILLPNYLRTMDALITTHPNASLYQSHFDFIDSKGEVLRPCMKMAEKMDAADFLKGQLTRSVDSMGTGYMTRSADYDLMGGIPTKYPNLIFADYALWMGLAEKSYLAVSNETTFQYRLHDSVSKVTNGQDYQDAFFLYLDFLKERIAKNPSLKEVFEKDGHSYLMFFCESLSHRLLKTPQGKRHVSVKDFLEKCRAYAQEMLPGQDFEPQRKVRVALAEWFDQNSLTRSAFKIVKQMTLLFNR